MKILVTGNMGYVGPGVVQQLRASYPQARLLGLDMGYFADALSGADILPECRVDVQYFGDVRCPPPDVMRDVDAVVHLAAISNDRDGEPFRAGHPRHQPSRDRGASQNGQGDRSIDVRVRLELQCLRFRRR